MKRSTRALAGTVLLILAVAVGTSVAAELRESSQGKARPSGADTEPRAGHVHSSPPAARHKVNLGRSVRGRPIVAVPTGNPISSQTVLVVGCIHGNEPAGIAIAKDLLSDPGPVGQRLWVLPVLNPDGRAADTRQNARGVDLNRNFPYRWRPLGPPGTLEYSGPHALSEPESRAAHAFIERIRPHISIWFHQAQDLVDRSGGSVAVERRYAQLVDLPLRRLPRYPGSAAGWENHRFRRTTAFVVELPPGRLSPADVERFSDGVLRLR